MAGMANRTRRLGRALADVHSENSPANSPTRPRTTATSLVTVDRFYPSSKTCSACGTVKAKLPLRRIFKCDDCGPTLDRDVNAARNIANEASRILEQHTTTTQQDVAGLRPERKR